jgi:hypothetical protein
VDSRPDTPDSSNEPVTLGGPQPVSIAQLQQQWPSITELPIEQQQLFSATVNLVPAPCESCIGKTIGQCGTSVSTQSCEGMSRIVRRTIAGIQEQRTPSQIRLRANYPDLWVDVDESQAGTNVHLFRDLNGLFSDNTEAVRVGLEQMFAGQIRWSIHEADVDGQQFGVRSRPTWFINGFRFRGVQSIGGLSRFIEYELEDSKRWER